MNKGDKVKAVVTITGDAFSNLPVPIRQGTEGVVEYVGVICDTVVVRFEGYGVCFVNKDEVSVCHGTTGS